MLYSDESDCERWDLPHIRSTGHGPIGYSDNWPNEQSGEFAAFAFQTWESSNHFGCALLLTSAHCSHHYFVCMFRLVDHPPLGTHYWHQHGVSGQDALDRWHLLMSNPSSDTYRSSDEWPVDTQLLLIGLINCMCQQHVCVGDYHQLPHVQEFLQMAVDEARVIRRCQRAPHYLLVFVCTHFLHCGAHSQVVTPDAFSDILALFMQGYAI